MSAGMKAERRETGEEPETDRIQVDSAGSGKLRNHQRRLTLSSDFSPSSTDRCLSVVISG